MMDTIKLFIATDDAACTRVKDYLEAWIVDREDVTLEIVPVLENPVQLIQLGINYTPALVVNGMVISQRCSVDEVQEWLREHRLDT